MAGKATLCGRNSREVRPVRRCDAGGLGVGCIETVRGKEKKKKEKVRESRQRVNGSCEKRFPDFSRGEERPEKRR